MINPERDLHFERIIDVPRELVWKAWTTPEQIKQWFTPRPWQTVDCEIDLRPGGRFYTAMRGPEGEEFSGAGCYLEVVENERLVWTNALEPDFRPANAGPEELVFTAMILLEDHPEGTKYTAVAMHKDEAGRTTHANMGFIEGWGRALDQLVELVKSR